MTKNEKYRQNILLRLRDLMDDKPDAWMPDALQLMLVFEINAFRRGRKSMQRDMKLPFFKQMLKEDVARELE